MNLLQHKLPPLTKAQQLELITKAQAGDTRAETQLLCSQLPWVLQRVRYWGKSDLAKDQSCLDDLFQEGCLAFVWAIRKYDGKADKGHGASLVSYADKALRSRLLVRRYKEAPVKLNPNGLRKLKAKVKGFGPEPTVAEQALLDRVVSLQKAFQPAKSLNAKYQHVANEDIAEWQDFLVDGQATIADEALTNHQTALLDHARLTKAMQVLTDDRDREVVALCYLRAPRLTLEQLGARWGVSRERARQIELRALGKLLPRFGWTGTIQAFMKAWRAQPKAVGEAEPLAPLSPDQVGRRQQPRRYELKGPRCDAGCGGGVRAGKDGILKPTCNKCLVLRVKAAKGDLKAAKLVARDAALKDIHQQLDQVLERSRG